MGGALPTPSIPGYTSFRGFTSCDCLAQWLPIYEQLLFIRGLIADQIDIIQLTGNAAASAGTHSQGGAADLLQFTDTQVKLAREMGAPAAWHRTTAQGFARDHQHLVLNACPHNAPARYQLDAQRAGFNGLGSDGRLGPDPLKGSPTTYRTWSQGISWAKQKIQEAMVDITLPDSVLTAIANKILWADLVPNNADADAGSFRNTLSQTYLRAGHAQDSSAAAADSAASLVPLVKALADQVTKLQATVDALPKA
jgi:hypothetical protein